MADYQDHLKRYRDQITASPDGLQQLKEAHHAGNMTGQKAKAALFAITEAEERMATEQKATAAEEQQRRHKLDTRLRIAPIAISILALIVSIIGLFIKL